jgi:hypothetical protein
MELSVLARPAFQAALIDLPWDVPLEQWPASHLVALPRGISRHIVRFVRVSGEVLALKEINEPLARREYRLLRELEGMGAPSVSPVGVVSGRSTPSDEPLDAVLVTEHLAWSLPYRTVFGQQPQAPTTERLLDALVLLMARLHLLGFAWNDCSLSNTLFRRDAGSFSAYLVDAETGERHEHLSDGQRAFDVETTAVNVAGEVMDLQSAVTDDSYFSGDAPEGAAGPDAAWLDPVEIAEQIPARYTALWRELTAEEEYDLSERWQIHRRIERLNALGFDVDEMNLRADTHGNRLHISPKVVDAGHHSRRLMRLTGLDVQENQARRMLNDLDAFRLATGRGDRPESEVASEWVLECYQPIVRAVPGELANKLTAAEVFHEVLEHRWYLAEQRGESVSTDEAAASYVASVLGHKPDERALLPEDEASD